jgi:glutamine synthetase
LHQLQEDTPSTFFAMQSSFSTDPLNVSLVSTTTRYIAQIHKLNPFSILSHLGHYCRNNCTATTATTTTMKFTAALIISAATSQQALAFAPTTPGSRPVFTTLNSVLTKVTGRSSLDPAVIARYDALPFPSDTILAEYVWVDADGNTRSKTRTLPAAKAESVESLPKWNFDGSSTGQAPGDDSEVILRPCRIFKDPFRPRSDGLDNILVMCDTWTPAGEPLPSNSRAIGTLHGACFERKDFFTIVSEFRLFQYLHHY